MPNKKFLETNYPRGKPKRYTSTTLGTGFASFISATLNTGISAKLNTGILALGSKTEILYFTPPGIAKRQFRPPLRGGVIGNPEAKPSGNYLN